MTTPDPALLGSSAEPPESVPEGNDPTDATQTASEADRKLRQENKSLRDRLRVAEGDLEAAVTRLGAAQHAEVERLAGEHLIDAKDIWRADDVSLDSFVDTEFREIVADRVVETAKALIASKPHLARPAPITAPPSQRPIESLRPGASPADQSSPVPTWADALRG